MNGFHLFGFLIAIMFIVLKNRIDGQAQNNKKVAFNILVAGAVVAASGWLGSTVLLQNLAIKGLIYVVLPATLWLAYRVQPEWFSGREKFLYCVILVLFSIAVGGEVL
ncbi:hypothetical protein SDC9_15018 [bioreactor metagenome]|uniref:Uncharacterized protein n=1 Tax=bioreactor metagenome TaxID=1076179 RepID=A0A644TUC1_9ZZZZ